MHGRDDDARGRAGRRRRHHRHRLRLPLGHVRAQRRRALHLLRQRRLHEYRRPALLGDAADRAHRDHAGHGRGAGQRVRHRQDRAEDRRRARHSLCRHRDRRRSARPRGQGHKAMGIPWRALYPDPRALPARLGLGVAGHDQAGAARGRNRAVSGVRSRDGDVTGRRKIRRQMPVEEYLKPQRRFAHLFTRRRRAGDRDAIARLQAHSPTATFEEYRICSRLAAGEREMKHPFAISARRRHEQAQSDRLLAHPAAGLCRPAAALQRRLPGRREHSGLARSRRIRRLRGRLARADRGQSAARRDGPGLLSPLRNRLQSRADRRGGRHQFGRALPRRRRDRQRLGVSTRRRAETRQARAGRRRRAVRPVRRLSSAPPRPCGDDPRGRAASPAA